MFFNVTYLLLANRFSRRCRRRINRKIPIVRWNGCRKKRRIKWKKHSTAVDWIKWKKKRWNEGFYTFFFWDRKKEKETARIFFSRFPFVWSLVCINCEQYSCLNVFIAKMLAEDLSEPVCGSKQAPKTPIIIWNWQSCYLICTLMLTFFSWLSHHQPN